MIKFTQIIIISIIFSANLFAVEKANHYKSGTFLSLDEKNKILRYFGYDSTGRPKHHKSIIAPGGFFIIHYDTSGAHSVDLTDENSNNIPDYVDSVAYYFDMVKNYYVNELNYLSPPNDPHYDGSEHYDVYIKDVGDGDPFGSYPRSSGGYYGITYNDFEIKPRRRFLRFTSFIVIDNNFAITDSIRDEINETTTRSYYETGMMGMKITVAHELHHAIQYAYGKADPFVITLAEMSSVWMENRIFPGSEDYWQYANSLLKNPQRYPFGITSAKTGYNHSVFAHYLYKTFGDGIIRRMWELIYDEELPFKALDSSLVERGSSLDSAWQDFMPWLYYTGDRARDGYLDDAENFREIRFDYDLKFEEPSIILTGYLKAYEIKAIRVIFPETGIRTSDTVDIMLSSLDLDAASHNSPRNSSYSIVFLSYPDDGAKKIEGTDYYYVISGSSNIEYKFFIYSGNKTYDIKSPYPNPFKLSSHDRLFFPVPEGLQLGANVRLSIYSSDMIEQFSGEFHVVSDNNKRSIMLDDIDFLKSGVYLYSVKYNDRQKFGKFAVTE